MLWLQESHSDVSTAPASRWKSGTSHGGKEKAMCEREHVKGSKITACGRGEPKFKTSSTGGWEISCDCRTVKRNSIWTPSTLLFAPLEKAGIWGDSRGNRGEGSGSPLTSMKNRAAVDVGWLLM